MDGSVPSNGARGEDPRGPVFAYRARVAEGSLAHDPALGTWADLARHSLASGDREQALDASVREGGDTGTPITATGAGAIAARFAELAERIEARRPVVATPPPAPADRIKKPLTML